MSARNYITIVSGMPRSGTSLMMQMLAAGGIPALTDNLRQPDRHNQQGYFEYEPVKRIGQDASWMAGALGKAVKIIYRLLRYLPPEFRYRIVFMQRDLGEVFSSQRDMLLARGEQAVEQEEDRMITSFAAELDEARRWLGAQSNVETLFVAYDDILAAPMRHALELSRYLDGLEAAAMAAIVNPQLRHHHRQR